MSLVVPERNQFQHIIRLLNTNVDGKDKITIALTSVKGVGRRFANIACKKADVHVNKRAGELSNEELERIVTILQNPAQYKIPNWFLNRQKDIVDGKYSQVISNVLDTKMREDLERMKRSVFIVVYVTTGVSVFVVNTLRLLVVVVEPLVSPRRNKLVTLNKSRYLLTSKVFKYIIYFFNC
ncbi:unnamed protein product [Cunninghamella echinulata]